MISKFLPIIYPSFIKLYYSKLNLKSIGLILKSDLMLIAYSVSTHLTFRRGFSNIVGALHMLAIG